MCSLAHARREVQAATRLAALTQLNTQLTTEVQQAQSAAAALEVKLERLHGRMITTQREAAAAAAAAAAAVAQDDTEAATAAAAAAAAAEAAQVQMKSEIGHLKSELAGTQAKASRAELELAVARTKALVAQQVRGGGGGALTPGTPSCTHTPAGLPWLQKGGARTSRSCGKALQQIDPVCVCEVSSEPHTLPSSTAQCMPASDTLPCLCLVIACVCGVVVGTQEAASARERVIKLEGEVSSLNVLLGTELSRTQVDVGESAS